MDRYQDHYDLLGIAPGDSWQKLRSAYQTQMRRWHPDRFNSNESSHLHAEEQSKLINQAYHELSVFYELHGKLPLDVQSTFTSESQLHSEYVNPEVTPESKDRSDRTATEPKAQKRQSKFTAVMLVMFILFIAVTIFWDTDTTEPPSDTAGPNPQTSTSSPTTVAQPVVSPDVPELRFGIGSTLGEVYSIQGVPTKVEGNVWYYGDARVFFQKGHVTHWTESEPARLKVQGISSASTPHATTVTLIDKGSSKDEVRAIQGAPLRETLEFWEYGPSRIYFDRYGRVSSWHESPLEPLHIKH